MSRKNRMLIDKLQRPLAVARVIAVVATFLFLIATPSPAYASGGGVGGGGSGGNGGGSGSGAWSKYGWGWAQYDMCNKPVPVSAQYPSGNKCGPTHDIYQGATWKTIYNTCNGSNAASVDIFIINYWNATTQKVQGSQGYEFHTVYEYPSQFAAHFKKGASVDGGRATAINTPPPKLVNGKVVYPSNPVSGTALDDWYQLTNNKISTSYQGTTYKFGATASSNVKGVAWFCANVPPDASCTANANPVTIPSGGSSKISVTGSVNPGNWPSTYYLRRGYPADIRLTPDGDSTATGGQADDTGTLTNTTNSPVTHTYRYYVASSKGSETTSGQPNDEVFNDTKCTVTVTVNPQPPSGTVSATCTPGATSTSPTPGIPFSSTYTITVTNTTGSAAPNYRLVAAPDGAGVTGATVTLTISIPTNTHPQSITLNNITANYAGTYTVTLYNPASASVPNTPCTQPVTPQVSPYFQAWQNDAAAGGGFRTPNISCPGNYPAYVSPPTAGAAGMGSPNKDYKGGIIANSSNFQSKSDFGAVALGYIPITPGNNLGFYTNVGTTSGPSLRLWFANTIAAGNEGYLNLASTNHCVDDFYTKTKINPTNISDVQTAITTCGHGPCQFTLPNDITISGPINIPNGMQLTLYATGNIKINTNITYQEPFNPNSRSDIPYFALITQGNVYVTNNAIELDGLYVVQPIPNGSGGITAAPNGVFATCDSGPCNNQLVVNGSVIAQHVQLLRAHGSSETLGCTPTCDQNGIGQAPAEIFNFVPSMVLGAPAFASFCQPACTQSAYSIAPVF